MSSPFRILAAATIATLLLMTGCASTPKSSSKSSSPPGLDVAQSSLSKEELADLLAQFEDTYEAAILDAADRILLAQPDRRTRRLTLIWQTRAIPMMRDALDQDDAVNAMLDAWALCLRAVHYFETGDARDMFGDKHQIAVDAARRSLDSIEQIASRILTPETLGRARDAVDDLACRFPLRGEFSGSIIRTAVEKSQKNPDVVASILSAPMAPFRAFEGIDRGAAAIQGFTAVAARMTDTVHDLPEILRLQTQLLVMELEEMESAQTALTGLQQISQSAEKMTAVAEQLPEHLRKEIALAADDLETRQAQLQQTLERVESAAGAVEQTATQAASAGDAWTQTVQAITEMVASFRQPHAAATNPATTQAVDTNDRRPLASAPSSTSEAGVFDVTEYTQAAQALDQAAVRLQELTREIRGLAGSKELETSLRDLETRSRQIVDASRAGALDVVDRGAWRGAQLVLLFFLGLIGYTFLVRLLPPRNKPLSSKRQTN